MARGAGGTAAIGRPMSGITRDAFIRADGLDTAGTGVIAHPTIGHPTPPSDQFTDRLRLTRDTVPRPISRDIGRQRIGRERILRAIAPERIPRVIGREPIL